MEQTNELLSNILLLSDLRQLQTRFGRNYSGEQTLETISRIRIWMIGYLVRVHICEFSLFLSRGYFCQSFCSLGLGEDWTKRISRQTSTSKVGSQRRNKRSQHSFAWSKNVIGTSYMHWKCRISLIGRSALHLLSLLLLVLLLLKAAFDKYAKMYSFSPNETARCLFLTMFSGPDTVQIAVTK